MFTKLRNTNKSTHRSENLREATPESEDSRDSSVPYSNNSSSNGTNNSSDSNNNDVRRLKWVNLASYGANVAITYGIGVGGWFGLPTNGELSAKYQTLVTPVGWAFSIWAVIFVAQALWVLRQWCYVDAVTASHVVAVNYKYMLTVLAQIGWTLTFSQELITISLAMMVCIWLNLLQSVRALATLPADRTATGWELVFKYVLLVAPFSIHFGWITAATVINVNVVLVDLALAPSLQWYAALASLAIVALGVLLMLRSQYLMPPVVLAWALLGVYVELSNPSEVLVSTFGAADGIEIRSVRYVAGAVAIGIVVAAAWNAVRQSRAARSGAPVEDNVYMRAEDRRQAGSRMHL